MQITHTTKVKHREQRNINKKEKIKNKKKERRITKRKLKITKIFKKEGSQKEN